MGGRLQRVADQFDATHYATTNGIAEAIDHYSLLVFAALAVRYGRALRNNFEVNPP